MSAVVRCPECKRQLRVPETAIGKTIRCPACKALIPSAAETPAEIVDPESSESDSLPPSRAVKAAPPPRTAPARSSRRPSRDEEEETADESPPVRRKPRRKKSSTGLIIGLALGGLLLVGMLATGVVLLVKFTRNKTIPESEWQAFSPPNGGCSILMPGTPAHSSQTMNGMVINQYEVDNKKINAKFTIGFFSMGANALQANALEIISNAARDNVKRTQNAQVISETPHSAGSIPGREVQFQSQNKAGFAIARTYLAKVGGEHRVYMVIVEGKSIQPGKDDAARFFDSFKLDASVKPPVFLDGAAKVGQQPPPVVRPIGPNLRPRAPRIRPPNR